MPASWRIQREEIGCELGVDARLHQPTPQLRQQRAVALPAQIAHQDTGGHPVHLKREFGNNSEVSAAAAAKGPEHLRAHGIAAAGGGGACCYHTAIGKDKSCAARAVGTRIKCKNRKTSTPTVEGSARAAAAAPDQRIDSQPKGAAEK